MTRQAARWIQLFIGLVLTGSFLWLALKNVEYNAVSVTLRQARWYWILVALAALACGYTARIYRWWQILSFYNQTLPFKACAAPLIVGVAVNNVAPFRAGDVLRLVAFRHQLSIPLSKLFGSLLIERILDLTILTAFLVIGVLGAGGHAAPQMYRQAVLVGAGFAALGWAALLTMGDRSESVLRRAFQHPLLVKRDWSKRVELPIQQLFTALGLMRTPRHALKLMAMSLLVWSGEGIVFASVALGLRYDGAPYGPWFALATGSLATLIPSSPGYVGTFDFFTISGLTAYGASPYVAPAIALIVHAVLWLPLTVIGLTLLLLLRLRGHWHRFDPKQFPEQK